MIYLDDAVFFGYPLSPADASDRQVGSALYDTRRDDLLHQTGAVVKAVVHHSVRSGDVPDATLEELAAEVHALPAPWPAAIRASLRAGTFVGTPIAEYVPPRLVNGRPALVGNAAHVPTPMTGAGVSSSLADAEALSQAIASSITIADALRDYEQRRLAGTRSLVESGQHFSRSFAAQPA